MQRLKLTQIFPNNLVQTIWLVELNFAFNPYFFPISNILEVGLSASKKIVLFAPLMKNTFHILLKALLFLKILSFCHDLIIM